MTHAESLFRAGRLTEAKAAWEAAPDDARLGTLALYENRPDDAVGHLEAALAGKRRPLGLGPRVQLAMAHYRADRFPAAARELARAAGPLRIGPLRGLAGLGRQLAAFGDTPPYRVEGPPATRLPFVATDPLPAVELAVNGGPPALFLLDTGGAELVLDTRFATAAKAEIVASLTGEYGGRRRARTGLGKVDAVTAGELDVRDVPVHTLDLGLIRTHFGLDVRGIVGTRFLMHFLATIDYPGGALTLRRRGDPPPGTRIPFWLAESHLILARGQLCDLPPALFWIDTGVAGGGLLATEKTLRKAGIAVDWSRSRQGPGGGGMVEETEVVADRLTLGEGEHAVTRHAVPGIVQRRSPSILAGKLGLEVGGLISHAFFRPAALTLDFRRMELTLTCPA
jgi:hypothetical protein